MTVFEILQPIAVQNGYKIEGTRITSSGSTYLVLPVYDDRSTPADVQTLMLAALVAAGVGHGVPNRTGVWSEVTVYEDLMCRTIQFPLWEPDTVNDDEPEGQGISVDGSSLFLFLLFWMFGVVVSPGWWKLGAVLFFPPIYFGVEKVAIAIGLVTP